MADRGSDESLGPKRLCETEDYAEPTLSSTGAGSGCGAGRVLVEGRSIAEHMRIVSKGSIATQRASSQQLHLRADLRRSPPMPEVRCPAQSCLPRRLKVTAGSRESVPRTPLIVWITTFTLFLLRLTSRFRDVNGSRFFLGGASCGVPRRKNVVTRTLRWSATAITERICAGTLCAMSASPASFRTTPSSQALRQETLKSPAA